MQIKHTINQTNIQYSKTHDFGEIKNISRQIHYTPRTILPEVGITTTAEYQTLTTFIPNTAIYIAADNQLFSHEPTTHCVSQRTVNINNLRFFLFFFGSRLCVPHRFPLRFTPPPYPYERFFARLACLQGH